MSIEKSSNRLLGEADDALYMICGNRTEREKRGGRGWRNGQAAAHKLARGDAHVRRADASAFAGCVVFAGVVGKSKNQKFSVFIFLIFYLIIFQCLFWQYIGKSFIYPIILC